MNDFETRTLPMQVVNEALVPAYPTEHTKLSELARQLQVRVRLHGLSLLLCCL